MADDTVVDGSEPQLTGIEKRKRNLRPPIRPGESRNPTGRNGRDKNKVVVDFLDALDNKDPDKRTRIQVLLDSMYLRARLGNGVAMRYLAEQYTGKAKQQIDLSSEDGTMSPTRLDAVASQLKAAMAAKLADAAEQTEQDHAQCVGGDAPPG
jgi:hypothetical protein